MQRLGYGQRVGFVTQLFWFYSYSVTRRTRPSHYPLNMKCVSMQSRLQWDHSQRQRVTKQLPYRITAAVWPKFYLSHQGTWVLQPLENVADSTDKCVYMNALCSESTNLCAQCVTRCLSCKILLVNLRGLRGPLLKAFVLLTFRHVFGKCDFMNSVSVSVLTVLLFKCIFTVNPLPNLGEKENHN